MDGVGAGVGLTGPSTGVPVTGTPGSITRIGTSLGPCITRITMATATTMETTTFVLLTAVPTIRPQARQILLGRFNRVQTSKIRVQLKVQPPRAPDQAVPDRTVMTNPQAPAPIAAPPTLASPSPPPTLPQVCSLFRRYSTWTLNSPPGPPLFERSRSLISEDQRVRHAPDSQSHLTPFFTSPLMPVVG